MELNRESHTLGPLTLLLWHICFFNIDSSIYLKKKKKIQVYIVFGFSFPFSFVKLTLLYWFSTLQVMCTWVHVEFHQTTIFLHTRLILLAVNDSCFKLRTLEVDMLFQIYKLMGLLAWHGLKMAIHCFIQ